MKKILAFLLVLMLLMSFAACSDTGSDGESSSDGAEESSSEPAESSSEADGESTGDDTATVMSYAEYVAADLEAPVVIEAYVQATQSWWDNTITAYLADEDGAYFAYEMACSEEDAAKLTAGTKIRVTGYKGAWAGEVEIMDATFEFVADADTYVAEAVDLTDLIASEELINYQNQLAIFKGMTVVSVTFKNDGGDDIYLTVSKNDIEYDFCVEVYLTGTDTEVYQAVSALTAGDVIDIEGFLYWYEGMNPHVTAVTAAE